MCGKAKWLVDAQQARSLDDFILYDQLLLYPLAALAEEDALTRAVLVRVSVSVSPWYLLGGCVQRVRTGCPRHKSSWSVHSFACA